LNVEKIPDRGAAHAAPFHCFTKEKVMPNNHVRIVVAEGKVTLKDLHAALEAAIRHVGGGCNCGLTGFDLSFLRGDPIAQELNKEMTQIPNIEAGVLARS
jgi:hypothetical protein